MENNDVKVIITRSPKSLGISILLSAIFGGLGMLYATILGGIIMFIFDLILWIFPLGWIVSLLLLRPIEIIWAIIATKSYNDKLLKGLI
ncbi:MAG: hypothetical protein IJZ86_08175 [Bacteroides sp.]|nr:hypothetical protein [Bacteroides sp.]